MYIHVPAYVLYIVSVHACGVGIITYSAHTLYKPLNMSSTIVCASVHVHVCVSYMYMYIVV